MGKSKKTIEVSVLLEKANAILAQKADGIIDTSYKGAVCDFIERVLNETGNYQGFTFLYGDYTYNSFNYFSRKYYSNFK